MNLDRELQDGVVRFDRGSGESEEKFGKECENSFEKGKGYVFLVANVKGFCLQ